MPDSSLGSRKAVSPTGSMFSYAKEPSWIEALS